MNKIPKGLSISFPIRAGEADGNIFGIDQDTKELLRSKISLLLSVERGERVFYGNYGTDLKKLLFDQNDTASETEVFNEIKRSVEDNFSLVKIKKVESSQEGNSVLLKVNFEYKEGSLTISDSINFRFQ